ncbi:TetR/AcrR family transcriptional regulator [Salidesulfovibrio onnuriiensis]|uniref:TetR/AcrR family transcriptional regulator n=1 Tax=Salidesulfovibrio onnuriiensis TaxID=2583823 RepID=UPI0011CA6CB5|nr:TetR/AcrR family transcriptional regulator [Salidesulfovibrio onnuriiensis]
MGKREENKQKKQRAILRAALEVFSGKGFAASRMSEVAQTAGVGKGTIYEYYRSKEDLFFGVFQWYVDEIVSAGMMDADKLGGTEADRLKAFLDTAIRSAEETRDYFSISLEFWAAAKTPALRGQFQGALQRLYNAFREVVAALIRDGKRSGVFHGDVDAEAVAAGLVGALDGIMLQAWMDESFDLRNNARLFADTVLRGIRNQGEPS